MLWPTESAADAVRESLWMDHKSGLQAEGLGSLFLCASQGIPVAHARLGEGD